MNNRINKILVPVYYSEEAFHAASIGVAIAKSMLASLVFMHIHVCEKKLLEAVSLNQDEVEGLSDSKLREFILKLVSDSCSGSLTDAVHQGAIEIESSTNSISDEICEYAQGHGVDMIVMGSHSRSNFKELFAGSISHEVVRKANCPVTVVH